MADSVTGRTYYENGQPVVVLVRWGGQISQNEPATGFIDAAAIRIRTGPRNVLVQRADGTKVVRPFRGLRRTPPTISPLPAMRFDDAGCPPVAPMRRFALKD
jgi:hypothetical protein